MNKTKHKSFHKVDTNFGMKKKVEICLKSRCLFLLPYTVVTRGTKNMYPLNPLYLTLFCQMNRDLEKKLLLQHNLAFFSYTVTQRGIHKLRCFLHFDIVFPNPFSQIFLNTKIVQELLKKIIMTKQYSIGANFVSFTDKTHMPTPLLRNVVYG